MAQRKPYNPNTKYGRKKLREQADKYYDNLSPAEKSNWDTAKFLIALVITAIMLTLGYVCRGQDIPLNSNLIVVHGVDFKQVVNRLLDSGYFIKKIDSNFNTAETELQEFNNNGVMQQMFLRVRVKDSTAFISGLFGFRDNSDGRYQPGSIAAAIGGVENPIANVKAWKKRKKPTPFTMMNNYALSFNKPVEYLTQ